MSKAAKPTTGALVKEAISTLKERGGSSLAAIKKFFTTKKIEVQPHVLRAALKKLTSKGELVKVKGSWKLGAVAVKKPKAPKKVKAAAKKPKAAKKAKTTTKKAAKKAAPAAEGAAAPAKAAKKAAKPKKAAAKKTKVAKPKAAKKVAAKK